MFNLKAVNIINITFAVAHLLMGNWLLPFERVKIAGTFFLFTYFSTTLFVLTLITSFLFLSNSYLFRSLADLLTWVCCLRWLTYIFFSFSLTLSWELWSLINCFWASSSHGISKIIWLMANVHFVIQGLGPV